MLIRQQNWITNFGPVGHICATIELNLKDNSGSLFFPTQLHRPCDNPEIFTTFKLT